MTSTIVTADKHQHGRKHMTASPSLSLRKKLTSSPLGASLKKRRSHKKRSVSPSLSLRKKLTASPLGASLKKRRSHKKRSVSPSLSLRRHMSKAAPLVASPSLSLRKRLVASPLVASPVLSERAGRRRGPNKTASQKLRKRKPSAYNLFVKHEMPVLRKKHPNMHATQRMREVAKLWHKKHGYSKKSSFKKSSKKMSTSYATSPALSEKRRMSNKNKKLSLSYLLKYY